MTHFIALDTQAVYEWITTKTSHTRDHEDKTDLSLSLYSHLTLS